jgi:hypothetical protein
VLFNIQKSIELSGDLAWQASAESSRVKILKKQEQIATEDFFAEYGRLGHPEYRIKNPPKSTHGKIA